MGNLFRHARFQAPVAMLRSAVSDVWRGAFAAAGRYQPMSAAESRWTQAEAVPFSGDIPAAAGAELRQHRLVFAEPRPLVEDVDDLVFTPCGGGWAGGCLYERFSARRPGLRMLLAPTRPVRELAEAYVVQAEHLDTFGDWFSEYLAPLARLGDIQAPVLLPQRMAGRRYVKRDAERLGVAFEGVAAPVLVRKAHVVRQQRVIRYWRDEDAAALRRLLRADPPPPRPGSILYLSRFGEQSEVADRTYSNETAERIVKARGGRVIRTADATLEDYVAAAGYAETILFDHGSAAYNMAYWRPRRAIEFVSKDWWMNAFLFFSDAIGVKDYTIIRCDLGDAHVAKRLEEALDAPLDASPAT